jgi:hypothetical protein
MTPNCLVESTGEPISARHSLSGQESPNNYGDFLLDSEIAIATTGRAHEGKDRQASHR